YALADTGLTAIELPEKTEVIAEGAFANSPRLSRIYLGVGVREIGQSAFSFCPNLSSLRLTQDVFRLEGSLLIDTRQNRVIACLSPLSPSKIVVSDSITEIGDSAFANNDRIETLVLPLSISRIGTWALRDMKNLRSLTIQSETISFGDNPLFGTSPENLVCSDEIFEILHDMNA
ncbi:MAG: leucine-rich repeat domain-containing protein, partial [Clostridia bacterium]|nr:leucine-rich repeat domain-containing protein [Clostridia bacterium]